MTVLMRPRPNMPVGFAQLANMRLALSTLLECQEAGPSQPRFGLFYGFSGYGKTTACAFAASQTQSAYIAAQSVWTSRTLLQAIARELGIAQPGKTSQEMLEKIVDQLNADPQALIIDEMDHIVSKRFVEILRDIHDATRSAILMIGEEALPQKLKAWERFDNRILIATAAQPCDAEDTLKLRDHYCTRVHIADDLALAFQEACKGITRRITTNLSEAQRIGIEAGVNEIDLEWWGNRPVRNGEVIARRRPA